jgi:hypothetical protein
MVILMEIASSNLQAYRGGLQYYKDSILVRMRRLSSGIKKYATALCNRQVQWPDQARSCR